MDRLKGNDGFFLGVRESERDSRSSGTRVRIYRMSWSFFSLWKWGRVGVG